MITPLIADSYYDEHKEHYQNEPTKDSPRYIISHLFFILNSHVNYTLYCEANKIYKLGFEIEGRNNYRNIEQYIQNRFLIGIVIHQIIDSSKYIDNFYFPSNLLNPNEWTSMINNPVFDIIKPQYE